MVALFDSETNPDAHRIEAFYRNFERSVFDPATGYNLAAEYYDAWKWQKIWGKVEWPHLAQILATKRLGPETPSSVLDIGVGTGTYLKRIADQFGFEICRGVDISDGMLRLAKKKLKKKAVLTLGSASDLPVPSNSVDVALLCRVGSHLRDLSKAAEEISRTLRSGGILVLSEIDPRHPYVYTELPFGVRKISVETYKHSITDWTTALGAAGLQIKGGIDFFQ